MPRPRRNIAQRDYANIKRTPFITYNLTLHPGTSAASAVSTDAPSTSTTFTDTDTIIFEVPEGHEEIPLKH
jgi:hypothetical protein